MDPKAPPAGPKARENDAHERALFAEVYPLVPGKALDHAFDYIVPERLTGTLRAGNLVVIPLGSRSELGVVGALRTTTGIGSSRLRTLTALLEDFSLSTAQLDLALWISTYYHAPLAGALRLMLPPGGLKRPAARIVLSEAGRGAFKRGELPAALQEVFKSATTALPKTRLTPSVLRSGLSRGLLEREYRVGLGGLKGPTHPWISWGDPCRLPKSALQKRLRAYLGDTTQPLSVVSSQTGTAVPSLRRLITAGVLGLEERPLADKASEVPISPGHRPVLNGDQKQALARVLERLDTGSPGTLLLYGVTGSGKTEVYLHAAEKVLERGRSVIVLVPEITLTHQTVALFLKRLGPRVALMHSGLSPSQRREAFREVAQGRARVVVGTRSALFAPLKAPGLIVIDEEQEDAYKQESAPRYHARDTAMKLAERCGALVLMGSATPSLESYKAHPHITLPLRAKGRPPHIQAVDMRGCNELVHPRIGKALAVTLSQGQKAVVLLNRRGYAPFAQCESCGLLYRCPSCDVSLTYHAPVGGFAHRLHCHHCGAVKELADLPACCEHPQLRFSGAGTQKLERLLAARYPHVPLLRLDTDTTTSYQHLGEVLEAFRAPGPAILMGTQMVAKGHDFPDVALAAVIDADQGLAFPDFRSEERTFRLLTQLAGRSGRSEMSGQVMVQTLNPGAAPIALACSGDQEEFYRRELKRREQWFYPPFSRLVALVLSSPDEEKLLKAGPFLAGKLASGRNFKVLGPTHLFRVRATYRSRLLLKFPSSSTQLKEQRPPPGRSAEREPFLSQLLLRYEQKFLQRGVRLSVDVDPQWL